MDKLDFTVENLEKIIFYVLMEVLIIEVTYIDANRIAS